MTSHPAIRVSGLSKLYRVGARQQGYRTLRESIADAFWAPFRSLSRWERAGVRVSQESGARGQEPGARGQEPGARGQESGARGQEPGARSQESGARSQGPALATSTSTSSSPRLAGDQFWALKDVSFEVQPGEVVGIIGRNGAGKSTLLKILSRITEPTSGRIELRGRVGSLLEVGTGFHPELTGRENIYMNGSILGMSRREIARKFDEIVAFAEVEDFLDTPVKRYSSGMYVRLAFAVAAHLEPEILIVDEVLAVGDAEFQRKCLGKMHDIAVGGRTVLFVSHNLAAVEHLCSRGIVLSDGLLLSDTDARSAVAQYSSSRSIGSAGSSTSRNLIELQHARRTGSEPAIEVIKLIGSTDCGEACVRAGDPITFEVRFNSSTKRKGYCIAIFITHNGQRLLMLHSKVNSLLALPQCFGAEIECHIPTMPLVPGVYDVDVALGTADSVVDYLERAITFEVLDSDYFGTGQVPKHTQARFIQSADWTARVTF